MKSGLSSERSDLDPTDAEKTTIQRRSNMRKTVTRVLVLEVAMIWLVWLVVWRKVLHAVYTFFYC